MADLTGEKLGRYRLEKLLGRGGMAAVYRARDEKLGREIAIKVILTEYVTDESFLRRFEQEAQLVARLKHPNILPIYDFGEDQGRPYLVMPLLDGGSLESRMTGSPIPSQLAMSWISQLAEALDAAHAAGILHRDVKPANVLLDDNDHLCLADFGIAKLLESAKGLTATGMVVGTPTYMAPEQAAGKPTLPASDRYALATLAFELLSGKPPYQGDSALSLLHQHVTAPVPLLSQRVRGFPAGVDAVLRKAMAKDPEERHSSCREFAQSLSLNVAGTFYAIPAPGSPRTAPLVAEGATEMVVIPIRTPGKAIPTLGTPKPSPVSTGAATVTAPAAMPSPVRRLWPLGMAAGVAIAVAGVIFVGSQKKEETAAASKLAELPAIPLVAPPVATIAVADPVTESPKVTVHELAPTVPSQTTTSLLPTAVPEPVRDQPPAIRPDEAAGMVAQAWARLQPEYRYGRRPDRAEFEAALKAAEQALKAKADPGAATSLVHFARGGLAYLSSDDQTARSELVQMLSGPVPGRGVGFLRDITRDGQDIPSWAVALAYLDPKRQAHDLMTEAEKGGDQRTWKGRKYLARLEGETQAEVEAGPPGRPGPPEGEPPVRPIRPGQRLRERFQKPPGPPPPPQ